MSMNASPTLSPPSHVNDDTTLRQPRRYSRKALASRFGNIEPFDALALFAFEEALNACDTTPYGLPHEWSTGDACPAPDGCYCIGMLGDNLADLVAEAQSVYRDADGPAHLFLGLGRTECGRIAITYELVNTSPPCGGRVIRATPDDVARQHSWLTPADMVALSCFLDDCTADVLLAHHWSDVPHRMGIDLAAVKPEEIVDRIAVNLWPLRLCLEDARKARSRVIIALQKTEKATILWYSAIADAVDNIKATTASTTSSPVSTRTQTTASRDALVQLPASKRATDDSRTGTMIISVAGDHSRPLVVGPQDPRDCAAVLSLYPDVSPDGLVVVFELDRALADLPRQWWNASSATNSMASATVHESVAVSKEIDLGKRQVKETAAAIRDAITRYADQYNDKDVVAVMWARPSSSGGIVTIGYALATLMRAAVIDSGALALAAAGDCAPLATRLGDIIEDRPDRERNGDDAICGGDYGGDDDDDVPPLGPVPHDLFDLVQLCPKLTGLQIAALSCVAESLKKHGICFKWLPTGLGSFNHVQRVKTRRWDAEWAAHSIMNAYYATVNPGGMIEIGITQRKDGGIDCMCAFVSRR